MGRPLMMTARATEVVVHDVKNSRFSTKGVREHDDGSTRSVRPARRACDALPVGTGTAPRVPRVDEADRYRRRGARVYRGGRGTTAILPRTRASASRRRASAASSRG